MATKRSTATAAGAKADGKPGSRLLRQLLTYFARDTVPPVGRSETVGQQAAKLVQTALDHLAAGDAEEAVKWTIHAMAEYCDLEKRDLRFENSDEKRDLAEWWKRDTEPAVKLWSTYVKGQGSRKGPVDKANDLMRDYWNAHHDNRCTKNAAAVWAAKQLRKRDPDIADNYDKTILRHLRPDILQLKWTR